MNDNKYLEKIALNAQAARIMAKKVGIIAEPTSAWKYALRKLRNGRGEALQGKSLHEARAKLGDVSNNTYQKIKSVHEHHGGTQGYEFSTRVNSRGKINDVINRGTVKGEVERRGLVTEKGNNLHTHPKAATNYRDYTTFKRTPARLAEPSGKVYLNESAKAYGKGEISSLIKDFRSSITERSQALKGFKSSMNKNDFTRANALGKKMDDANDYLRKVDSAIKGPKSFTSGDATSLVRKNMYKQDRHMERIVAPDHNVVSSNKSRGDGIRTVYFDHTPKKMK